MSDNNLRNSQYYNFSKEDVINSTSSMISSENNTQVSNQVKSILNSIDLTNQKAVIEYGSNVQDKVADYSKTILSQTSQKDLGVVGDALENIIHELDSADIDKEKNFFVKVFKRGKTNINKIKTKYAKVETNIDGIVKKLEVHQGTLAKDIDVLDGLFNNSVEYLKEIQAYIEAGKLKIEQVKSTDIPLLESVVADTKDAQDIQKLKDLKDMTDRFEKRLYDLQLTREISIQSLPQIRLVQNNNAVMIEKIHSTLVNVIPLWKNQLVLSIGLHHSNEAAKTQELISNATNKLLKQNADMLKMSSIETAKASERGIVDLDTLKYTSKVLVETLTQVLDIQKEGRAKRLAAEKELQNIESDLKTKLISASTN